jgi:DNA-binding response OmpR family regulator
MRLLLAEDEKELSHALTAILKIKGYETDAVYDGASALEKVMSETYDGVILDIMMPKMSGLEVLEEMRREKILVPVLLLTAKAEVENRVEGLNLGADDYMAKPFSMDELLARVNALVRRGGDYSMQTYRVGNVLLKADDMEMSVEENSLRIAGKEVRMLAMFMKNPGRIIRVSQFIEHLSDEETVNEDMVNLYISYLKNKLSSIHANVTIKGNIEQGFRLAEE